MSVRDMTKLPVYGKLPDISRAASERGGCILRAAPGAGKTMLVPAALSDCFKGKILLIEPRRIAAKAAAAGIAFFRQWTLGKEAGFIVRGENMTCPATRVVCATGGVVLNLLQNDPELREYDAVIFDEFHERSAEQDLIFALLGEVRSVFREDLALVIMSATLEEELGKKLPELPEIEVGGREFPVEISSREIAREFYQLPLETARAVKAVYGASAGDILVFLPGKNEIERCFSLLENSFPDAEIMKLHGSLPLHEQSRVMQHLENGKRKIVLSTNIAESSLTIDGITTVIDSGWERRMRFVPGMGMPVLEPCRISLASAKQRAGRAGRTAPGKAVRLWSRQEELSFPEQLPPEILECDLCRIVLEIARWGGTPEGIQWLTPPPESGVAVAVKTLRSLGLLDRDGTLTPEGRRAVQLPLHPRLGAMLLFAEKHGMLPLACEVAVLIEESSRMKSGESCDISELLKTFRRIPGKFPQASRSLKQLKGFFHISGGAGSDDDCGVLIARAYPEYIGRARSLHSTSYQLSGGRTASIREDDELRKEEFLAIADLGIVAGKEASIRLAAPVSETEIKEYFSGEMAECRELDFDENTGKVYGEISLKLGSLVMERRPFVPERGELASAVLNGAIRRKLVLFPEKSPARRFLERVRFAFRNDDTAFPDWSDEALKELLPEMALPFLEGVKDFNSLQNVNFLEMFKSALDYSQLELLNRSYPDKYRTPAGTEITIDYSGEQPTLAVLIPQMFGEKLHPCVGKKKLPLRLELLSPARRPVQITCDLPNFWRGSWSLVRAEMRSRYPKHEWPEHPEDFSPMRSSVKKRS